MKHQTVLVCICYIQYLKKEVQDGWLVAGRAWGLHGNALLQTLSLFLLEQHLRDILSHPLIGYVHAQLECTQYTHQPVNRHFNAHNIRFLLRDTVFYVFVFFKHTNAQIQSKKQTAFAPSQW